MGGPSHYREAERLLGPRTVGHLDGRSGTYEAPPTTDAILQGVGHAILALTAATAANIRKNGAVTTGSEAGWREVIGSEPVEAQAEPESPIGVKPRLVLIGSQLEATDYIHGMPHSEIKESVHISRELGLQQLRGMHGPVEAVWLPTSSSWPDERIREINQQLSIVRLADQTP